MHTMGSNGSNGSPDIYSYRCTYNSDKVVVSKLTNVSSITCTATKSNGTIHFTFNGSYVRAVILAL